MRADGAAREDRGVFRLYRPDLDIRVLRLEHLADAADGTAGTDARAETVDGARNLLHDLQPRVVLVHLWICGVFKLLGNIDVGIFSLDAERCAQAFVDAFADVAVVMHKAHLRTVMLDKLPAFNADRIRHDNDGSVAAHSADERKADALIAARRFDDDGVFCDEPVSLGAADHIVRCARLDRAADVQPFEFDENLRAVRIGHPVQTDQRRVPDRIENIVVNHEKDPFAVAAQPGSCIVAAKGYGKGG